MGRGRPLTEKREEFVRLVRAGVSLSEACRRVGVHRKTGIRWRHGRTITTVRGLRRHYASVMADPVREISPRFLSADERVQLADLHRRGAGVREIARTLGRSPSTISRELRRNADPVTGRYLPFAAHRLAVDRRARPGRGRFLRDAALREFVEELLEQRWSPEQIANRLRLAFADEPSRQVVAETIYQAVYRPDLGGLCRQLPRALRTGRRRRRPQRRPDTRRPAALTNMRMLCERPVGAADRTVPGHWEGDLITGTGNRSAIGTLVERVSRFTVLVHLPGGRHTADAVHDALRAAMAELPARVRLSLTWDQGREMALHADLAAALDMPVFFCDPHCPWQRPTNENTNGLLRQYFPKGTDLRIHTAADLDRVAAELNARPRKTLGWCTPADRFAEIISRPTVAAVNRRNR